MRVLVTGGAGYIGSHTCIRLLEAGHAVTVLDNFQNSRPEVLDRVQTITDATLEVLHADVRAPESFTEFMGEWKPEAVVHFAGLKSVNESVEKPADYYSTNVQGTVNVARAFVEVGGGAFVFSSTAAVYGAEATMPVTEDSPTRPVNPYGWSKLMAEQVLKDVHTAHPQLSVALLRYFNPVGAHPSGLIGEDPAGVPANLMPYMARVADGTYPSLKVFGSDYPTADGSGVRDFLHVDDLAESHLVALKSLVGDPGLVTWNVGRGEGVSVFEMVAAFQRVTGRRIPYSVEPRRPGDVAESYADPTEIERATSWRAGRSVDDMVADLWRWQKRSSAD